MRDIKPKRIFINVSVNEETAEALDRWSKEWDVFKSSIGGDLLQMMIPSGEKYKGGIIARHLQRNPPKVVTPPKLESPKINSQSEEIILKKIQEMLSPLREENELLRNELSKLKSDLGG